MDPASFCGGHAGFCAFGDEVALELGQGGHDVEIEPPACGGGVDSVLKRAEADVAVCERLQGLCQMPQRAAQPVELPDHQTIARLKLGQRLIETGARDLRAGNTTIFEYLIAAYRS